LRELDAALLDRDLRRVARDWRRWRRRLSSNEPNDDPFDLFPFVSSTTWAMVGELPDYDPLRAPLRRWLYRLLDDKANRASIAECSRTRYVDTTPLDQPERGEFSLARLIALALAEPERRSTWTKIWLDCAAQHAGAVQRLWERRQEVARRLDFETPDAIVSPCPEIEPLAVSFLDRTRDLFDEWRRDNLADLVHVSLGIEASAGWPRALAPRTLADFFRETRLLEGLELDPGELPEAIAPASFVRALARLGAAFADAAASRTHPFTIAHDPYGLRRRTLGAVFASLGASRLFLKKKLDLGSDRARDHERAMARVVLIEARAAALRVVLRQAALEGVRAFGERFEFETERVFGAPLHKSLAGAIFRIHEDDPQRFAGIMLAASEVEVLIDAHDDDWWRNPRAADQLRSEAGLPPAIITTKAVVEAGIEDFKKTIGRALG
jgi:hypothetical protein